MAMQISSVNELRTAMTLTDAEREKIWKVLSDLLKRRSPTTNKEK